MRLPDLLSVQLRPVGELQGGLADLLVAIDFTIGGNYYFGELLGLTDANGRVSVTRADLDARFHEAQATYLMDLKVPLAECDPVIIIKIEAGMSFVSARSRALAALGSAVRADAMAAWDRARNALVRPAQVLIDTRAAAVTDIALPVQPVAEVAT